MTTSLAGGHLSSDLLTVRASNWHIHFFQLLDHLEVKSFWRGDVRIIFLIFFGLSLEFSFARAAGPESFRCDVLDGLHVLDSLDVIFSGSYVSRENETEKTYLRVSLDKFSEDETVIYIQVRDKITGLTAVTKAAVGTSLATQASLFKDDGGLLGDPQIRTLAGICSRR